MTARAQRGRQWWMGPVAIMTLLVHVESSCTGGSTTCYNRYIPGYHNDWFDEYGGAFYGDNFATLAECTSYANMFSAPCAAQQPCADDETLCAAGAPLCP